VSETIPSCFDFTEHPGWRNNPDKTMGVTWDAWCSFCGFRAENRPFATGCSIEADGRRLAPVVSKIRVGEQILVSERRQIACSKCCPKILQG